MKTRIDFISGHYGAGKSQLIGRMLESVSSPYGYTAAFALAHGGPEGQQALSEFLSLRKPQRVLLELAGNMLLEDGPALLEHPGLSAIAYGGAPVAVVDARAFIREHAPQPQYYERQICRAALLFVNHIEELSAAEKLAVLGRIWDINRHVHLMVEPLHGVDLWRVFDLPGKP